MAEERLQKVLAAAGLGSRRACEEFIVQGRVTLDGERVTELGTKADPARQRVECDGERLRPAKKLHFPVHKPIVCFSPRRITERVANDFRSIFQYEFQFIHQ